MGQNLPETFDTNLIFQKNYELSNLAAGSLLTPIQLQECSLHKICAPAFLFDCSDQAIVSMQLIAIILSHPHLHTPGCKENLTQKEIKVLGISLIVLHSFRPLDWVVLDITDCSRPTCTAFSLAIILPALVTNIVAFPFTNVRPGKELFGNLLL